MATASSPVADVPLSQNQHQARAARVIDQGHINEPDRLNVKLKSTR